MTSRERWQSGTKLAKGRGIRFAFGWAAALSSASGPIEGRLAVAVPHNSRSSNDPIQCATSKAPVQGLEICDALHYLYVIQRLVQLIYIYLLCFTKRGPPPSTGRKKRKGTTKDFFGFQEKPITTSLWTFRSLIIAANLDFWRNA